MMNLLAPAGVTAYLDQAAGRGLSPNLWKHAIKGNYTPDGHAPGYFWFDDFMSFQGVTVTTAAGQLQPGNGYFAYIEADATVGSILPLATEVGGVIRFLTSTDAADGNNHQTVLAACGNAGTQVKYDASAGKLLIFEARIRLTSVTNGDGSVFVGLGEEGLAAGATPLADDTGHKLASKDLIGFAITEDNNDALTFRYRKAGAAEQTLLTYGTALAAGTFVNVGFVIDPSAIPSQRGKVYINNVEQGTYLTQTMLEAATFPTGEELALVASIIGSADADAQSFDMDWWAVYAAA